MAINTSFGQRRALGRRYATDPALLLEAQRLQEEYGLKPGQEARAVQREQLAQQLNMFNTAQENAKVGGMVGTAANLAATRGIVSAYTGEPFFGNYLTNMFNKPVEAPVGVISGSTPASMVPSATSPSFWTGPASTSGGSPFAASTGYPGAATTMAGTTPLTGGGLPAVNPATTDMASSGIGLAGAAPEGTGMVAAATPYLAGAGAADIAGRGMQALAPEGTAVNRTGQFLQGATEWPVTAVTNPSEGAKQAQNFISDYVTKPVESVVNFLGNAIGW